MITRSLLTGVLGVNGQVVCDCGKFSFEVGLGINPTNGNNFIRLLQCTACGKQMAATHESEGLAPKLMNLGGGGVVGGGGVGSG